MRKNRVFGTWQLRSWWMHGGASQGAWSSRHLASATEGGTRGIDEGRDTKEAAEAARKQGKKTRQRLNRWLVASSDQRRGRRWRKRKGTTQSEESEGKNDAFAYYSRSWGDKCIEVVQAAQGHTCMTGLLGSGPAPQSPGQWWTSTPSCSLTWSASSHYAFVTLSSRFLLCCDYAVVCFL